MEVLFVAAGKKKKKGKLEDTKNNFWEGDWIESCQETRPLGGLVSRLPVLRCIPSVIPQTSVTTTAHKLH